MEERRRNGGRTQDHGVLYQRAKSGSSHWVSLTPLQNPLEMGGIGGGVILRFSICFFFCRAARGGIENLDSGLLQYRVIPK